MGVENNLFLFDSTNDMDISIWYDYSLWIIWKIIQIVELLYLVRFVLEVEQIAMSLFYGENWNLLNVACKIRWLSDGYALFICLDRPTIVLGRYSVA